ncbi:MAG: beta-galactosidase, partial [Caldilineaceae bacterium]|nr:beta-galactosidase [Caldilineaceae bacterium]
WKIKRTLEMVREMGAPWVVEYFPWAYIQPKPDVWKWKHSDEVIAHANRQGLTVIARLGYVPEWARPPETTPLFLDEEHFADFGRFAAEFVTHYAGQVDYVIIWNEPNLALEWGYAAVDPVKYTAMLKVVYPMIKAANPDVQVLAGALAPTLAPPGSEWGMNDLDFLQAMYDAGAADYFDILAVHAYGWSFPPDEPAAPDVVNFRRTELLRDIMVRNGDGAKAAMI